MYLNKQINRNYIGKGMVSKKKNRNFTFFSKNYAFFKLEKKFTHQKNEWKKTRKKQRSVKAQKLLLQLLLKVVIANSSYTITTKIFNYN